MKLFLPILVGFLILGMSRRGPQAAAAPRAIDWPQVSLHPIASGFTRPVHITHASDDSGRLFIVEQGGTIRILQSGTLLAEPFLNITDRVRAPGSGGGSEEGLLSAAFPPDFSQRGYFYVYYTNLAGDNQVSRFHLAGAPNLGDPASEEQVLYLNHPTHGNHNGGQIAFGPDGYLYIGAGDGGGGGDPDENAQDPAALLGKLLRIDVEAGVMTYTIPVSNPYTQTVGYRAEIWALGLRNPWRFAFDRETGDLYIGDVGQDRIEEIDFQPSASAGGENYGWDNLEGSQCYEPSSGCTQPTSYVPPVAEYEHGINDSNGCSVTGGQVYRGGLYPRMQGMYFYVDYCTGKFYGLINDGGMWQSQQLLDLDFFIPTFGEDQIGNLYIADMNRGIIYRLADNVTIPLEQVYLPVVLR